MKLSNLTQLSQLEDWLFVYLASDEGFPARSLESLDRERSLWNDDSLSTLYCRLYPVSAQYIDLLH